MTTPFKEPPPIEDLPELSWRRLEEEVLSRTETKSVLPTLRKRGHRRTIAVASAVVLAAAAAVALFVVRDGGKEVGERLPLSRLVTEDSPSTMSVGDATLRAGTHTALVVSDAGESGVRVILERGIVDCQVAPRPGRAPFVVVAGNVSVEVTGTAFRVERIGDGARVDVERGTVRVLENGELHELGAGDSWPEPTARNDLDDTPAIDAPSAAAKPKPKSKPKTKPKNRVPAKVRYAQAAALESTKPTEALAIYRSLSRERGPWAANALFAMARLELERGNVARARKALNRYLRRYPKGANAADARALLDRTR